MKTKLFFTACFLTIGLLKAQTIITVAGSGTNGFGGDGGQANAAKLYWPWGGCLDATGNMYITDIMNNRVRKVNTSGVISTVVGNGTIGYTGDGGQATAAGINIKAADANVNSCDIAFDASGNMYIDDFGNNVIRKVDNQGIITTVAGTGTAGYNGDGIQATAAQLNGPSGVKCDAQGNLYIADSFNNRVRKVSSAGVISTVVGNGSGGYAGDGAQAINAELSDIGSIAFDASGNLYIADGGNNRIRKVNSAGVINTVVGSGGAGYGHGGFSGDGGQATNATLNDASNITFDNQGNLFISDWINQRIREVNTSGTITTIAGTGVQGYNGDGIQATTAELCEPGGLFCDASGNLYITDICNSRMRKVIISTSVPPVANFHASGTVVCAGSTITFSDSTTNASVTSYQWNFPGGVLASGYTLTDPSPKVIYNTPGMYAVTYTAGNSAGQGTITKTAYINVLTAQATYSTNFTEGFETAALPGTDWSVSSTSGTNWVITSAAAVAGTKSAMINNMVNTINDTSTLTSSTFNLAAIGSPVLAFSMAYQQKATTNTDKLQVYTSTDCGLSWISKWARANTSLQPSSVSGQSTSSFVPSPGQFTTYTVNLSSIASSTNVMFRWVFYAGTSSVGNNIYLDNINISNATTEIKSIEEEIGFTLYPNPSLGTATVSFPLSQKQNVSIQVTDVIGRVVETIPVQSLSAGENDIIIGTKAQYQPGIYFVNIDINGRYVSKKLIIQQK